MMEGGRAPAAPSLSRRMRSSFIILSLLLVLPAPAQTKRTASAHTVWTERASAVAQRFYAVYTSGWEGANGAIGDAFLFRATGDTAILHRYRTRFPLTAMFNGTWVDDRAWICLAELYWWEFTGRKNGVWLADARQRYDEAKKEGRLSSHEGYWSWYNYPPRWNVGERIFTNSNMNLMAAVACRLYEATGERKYLDDALLVWNGDVRTPGVERTFYRGNGVWAGRGGAAAFGKQLPWESASYLTLLNALHRATKEERYRTIAVASARHILDPANGWVDGEDFYQKHMDGNGAFVHYLFDAYDISPKELAEVPVKVERMLNHVWTNHHGRATVTLHRASDHGIRNGWNPNGGEDGYGVDEIGTVHAQSQALRAFGVFAFYHSRHR